MDYMVEGRVHGMSFGTNQWPICRKIGRKSHQQLFLQAAQMLVSAARFLTHWYDFYTPLD